MDQNEVANQLRSLHTITQEVLRVLEAARVQINQRLDNNTRSWRMPVSARSGQWAINSMVAGGKPVLQLQPRSGVSDLDKKLQILKSLAKLYDLLVEHPSTPADAVWIRAY
ncbi:MAG TPA: hypothetical protein VFT87_03525 [Candidatus Saccharimonadales bacterium]|nr:hypothetical protein [Candidatus Saccharimonadales bacterium]